MNTEKNGVSFFTVEKAAVVNEIKHSQKELRMLGTTAFNLPWQENHFELYELLYEKYCGNKYEISIVSESDPTLYSNALVSGLGYRGAGIPIATLTEIRENSTLKLRSFFLSKNSKIGGLDPTEDSCRSKLDSLYTKKFAKNICKELENRGYNLDTQFKLEDESQEKNISILNRIQNACMEKSRLAFEKSDIFSYHLANRQYYHLNKASVQYENEVAEALKEKLSDVHREINKPDMLFQFAENGFSYIYEDDRSNKSCGFKMSVKEIQDICLNSILEYLEEHEPRDYNLIREYASKEAYTERGEQLKKFEADIAIKQRFSLKQIFHNIPVQMLLIDGKYYATMFPLQSFKTNKFLYVGNSNLTKEEDINRFEKYEEYVQYFNILMHI